MLRSVRKTLEVMWDFMSLQLPIKKNDEYYLLSFILR